MSALCPDLFFWCYSLAAIFVEQAAIDGGRFQVAWLLTGLPTPPFNLTSKNISRLQEEPFGLLLDPSWLSANLAYLKDLDYFEQRQRQAGSGTGLASQETPPAVPPKKPRPPRPRPPKGGQPPKGGPPPKP